MNRFMGSGLVIIVVYMLFSSFGKPVYGVPIVQYSYTATRAAGGSVSGLFAYDLGVLDSHAPTNLGVYSGATSWSGAVTGGPQAGIIFSFSGIGTKIWNNFTPSLSPFDAIELGDIATLDSFIRLRDAQATAFSNDSLPLDIVLADFVDAGDDRRMHLHSNDVGGPPFGQTSYVFQSINAVPEPATMLLLGIGLVGLAGASARRRFKKVKQE